LAARLTQEALAERAGLSVNGIQKLESGGTRPYRDTVRRLIEALHVTPDEVVAFQTAAQPQPRPSAPKVQGTQAGEASSSQTGHELPAALTSFIGREAELDEITQLLPTTRLLTLTGVGGCGKTRLSLETARLVGSGYADGVRLVELATVADAALVPQAVAAALGIRETPTQPLVTTIIATLREQGLLLLLDNCEHLLEACTQLADVLLRACPGVHILATSREPLGITGEVTRHVSSLAIPPVDLLSPSMADELGQYASVQLFVDRARAFSPGLAITDRTAPAIAQICQRLDGIPLALELAAALIRGLSVDEIAARLDQRFRLLTSGSRAALPRQQTLQATIDWSYALLSAAEQTLFARLSVFVGRWSLEAAEGICRGNSIEPEHVLGLLLHLVDKSLVVVEDDNDAGNRRYRLLDTLRQYGRERLLASGESEAVHHQHASYFLALAEGADHVELNQTWQADWIERLALHESDLVAAVDWLVAHREVHDALRLGGVLGSYWQIRGHLREGRRRLELLLNLPVAAAPTLARAKALYSAGLLTLYQGDLPATSAFLKESLTLFRQHQHLSGVAWVLIHLGWLCHDHFRLKAARRFLQEALVLCRQLDDRTGLARCLNVQGMVANNSGDIGRACALHRECLVLSREVDDRWGTAWALANLGWDLMILAEIGQGDPNSAEVVLEEALVIWQELGERRHIAFCQMNLGVIAVLQGRLGLAQDRISVAASAFTEMDDRVAMGILLTNWSMLLWAQGQLEQFVRAFAASVAQMPSNRHDHLAAPIMDQRLETAGATLGRARFDAVWADGGAMTLEAAVAYCVSHVVTER
jgi:predicted ATPase